MFGNIGMTIMGKGKLPTEIIHFFINLHAFPRLVIKARFASSLFIMFMRSNCLAICALQLATFFQFLLFWGAVKVSGTFSAFSMHLAGPAPMTSTEGRGRLVPRWRQMRPAVGKRRLLLARYQQRKAGGRRSCLELLAFRRRLTIGSQRKKMLRYKVPNWIIIIGLLRIRDDRMAG